MNIIQRVAELVNPVADQMGLEIVDIENVTEDGKHFVRIYIYQSQQLDLNLCEQFHRAILDMLDEIDYDYLEVSTPGDRALKSLRDYERNLQKPVLVKLKKPDEAGKRTYRGALLSVTERQVTIMVNEEERTMDRGLIRFVKPDFS